VLCRTGAQIPTWKSFCFSFFLFELAVIFAVSWSRERSRTDMILIPARDTSCDLCLGQRHPKQASSIDREHRQSKASNRHVGPAADGRVPVRPTEPYHGPSFLSRVSTACTLDLPRASQLPASNHIPPQNPMFGSRQPTGGEEVGRRNNNMDMLLA
jgi:hypothetical protein